MEKMGQAEINDCGGLTSRKAPYQRIQSPCRGQKHQRREKQHQLMEASAELATTSANALLSDKDSEGEDPPPAGGTGEHGVGSGDLDLGDERPLKSPFEEFRPVERSHGGGGAPSVPPTGGLGRSLLHHPSHRSVRFNGPLESFSEEPEGSSSLWSLLPLAGWKLVGMDVLQVKGCEVCCMLRIYFFGYGRNLCMSCIISAQRLSFYRTLSEA